MQFRTYKPLSAELLLIPIPLVLLLILHGQRHSGQPPKA